MGRVVKRGKVWYLRYTANGRQVVVSTHSSNRRFAEKLLGIRVAEAAEGRQPFMARSNAPRLKEWAEQFLESVQGKPTRMRYTSSVANLTRILGERARLSEIEHPQIERFKRERLKEGVKASTINRDLAVLRRMLKLAGKERLIARSPFADDGVERLEERKARRRPRIISFDEEQKILGVCPPLLRALVVLLLETGLRVGKEALPLQWEAVDFTNDTIQVRESKSLAGRRVVYMSKLCKTELLRWKELMGPDFSPFVFPNPSIPALHVKSVRRPWTAALKNAKQPWFWIYDLRANFASRLSASGAPDNLVAGVIGHSSTSIVSTYAKVVDLHRRDAIKQLEAYRQAQIEKAEANPEVSTPTERLN